MLPPSQKFGLINQRIQGNFSSFGKSEVKINLPWDTALIEELEEDARNSFESLPNLELDHGTMVPLGFCKSWMG